MSPTTKPETKTYDIIFRCRGNFAATVEIEAASFEEAVKLGQGMSFEDVEDFARDGWESIGIMEEETFEYDCDEQEDPDEE